ncbi:MAG TPA: metal ABC transporter ATP-binding protein [Methanobacteriaceae archaeon]|nr:metal ABC transporter ATP-binding protein [Methanobacteriaceae archaeon]
METAVIIKNLSFYYQQKKVLDHVNLQVPHKSFLAIIGPNGGGKSTLFRTILGLIKPQEGEVKVFDHSPVKARNIMGYLPQHVSFLPDFPINVLDTVLTGRYHGLLKSYHQEDRDSAFKVLKEVGMDGLEKRQIGGLSGGQLQRVFLARALVRNPKLLLLDEPMASVDPQMQYSFYQLLDQLKKRMTIILVTHDVGAVSEQVDHIACLNQRLFYHGPVDEAAHGLEEVYGCPLELISHGIPHRILREH